MYEEVPYERCRSQSSNRSKEHSVRDGFFSRRGSCLALCDWPGKQYGAKVHGLHVRFPATYPIVGPEAMPQVLEAAEEQAKFEAQQLHEMFATVPHEVTITEGDLWPTLSEIVEKQKTDLIVMGTHGRKGVSRALLGSTAEEIFRKASCPVLTVGPHVSQNTERRLAMKQILFATDFSPSLLPRCRSRCPWRKSTSRI